jgi:hypothetical protein
VLELYWIFGGWQIMNIALLPWIILSALSLLWLHKKDAKAI